MDIGPAVESRPSMPGPPDDVTALLRAWGEGDEQALHQLMPVVERELNRVARACLAGDRGNRSVSATALVNETFLRLVQLDRIDWRDRAHFLSIGARLMRRVLVDLARARRSDKRGGDAVRVSLDEAMPGGTREADVVRLDEALDALARVDPRKGRVIELRFFGGLSAEETAAILEVSTKTVIRDWTFAKAWLQREMTSEVRAR
jgi:RNA polymerase sigma-70 factor (ECF subfamily)